MRENEQAITRFPKCAFVYPHSCGRKNLKQNRRLVATSLTGISPRPMLMGAPHDALRASNAGVSLWVPVVVAHRVPLCFGTASVSLPPMWEIMADAAAWLAPARMYLSAIFAPQMQLFSMCSIGSLSACISYQRFDGWCTLIKKKLRRRCGKGNTPPPQKQGEAF